MTLAERREELLAELRTITFSPCVGCGHPFGDHRMWDDGRCKGKGPCGCRRFVDPSERLSLA